jgi:hypothetical protein
MGATPSLAELVNGPGGAVKFDYMKLPGEPMLGLVLCENAETGDRWTMIGPPAVVAAWEATPQNARPRRVRALERLLNRSGLVAKAGWPADWITEELEES